MEKFKVAEFGNYDRYRFGTPWFAKLSGNPGTTKLNYEFVDGAYVSNSDGTGEIRVNLVEGDYFAWGQKDKQDKASIYFYGLFSNGQIHALSKKNVISTLNGLE